MPTTVVVQACYNELARRERATGPAIKTYTDLFTREARFSCRGFPMDNASSIIITPANKYWTLNRPLSSWISHYNHVWSIVKWLITISNSSNYDAKQSLIISASVPHRSIHDFNHEGSSSPLVSTTLPDATAFPQAIPLTWLQHAINLRSIICTVPGGRVVQFPMGNPNDKSTFFSKNSSQIITSWNEKNTANSVWMNDA